MAKNLELKAVLWDMDGVIVDTFDGHYRSWQQTFDEMSQPYSLEMFRSTFGMNNRSILQSVLNRELPEEQFQKVSDRKEELFRQLIHGSAQLLPGVATWLQRFKERSIKQAVASSAPQTNIDALLDELQIRYYFQAEASGATLKGKPDPAVFLLAARRLGVDPRHCLVIEDAVAGVEAACRAGMRCVAVLTTNTAENLAGADVVLQDLTSLTDEHLSGLFENN